MTAWKIDSMKVKILANTRKGWASSLSRSIESFLRSRGFSISHSSADATICIGGDGTIFHYAYFGKTSGSILGIGSKTSSVCQFHHEKLSMSKLISALNANKTEKRLTISARVNEDSKSFHSINDIVIHTHDYRVITVSLKVDKKTYKFEGDGIIISTPTGSSAYCYSAGGKILPRSERRISIVPICPYKRSLKPMIVDESAEITISANRTSDFIIDGIYVGRLQPETKLHIKKGKDAEFLVV
jgi:NAD+ kinase